MALYPFDQNRTNLAEQAVASGKPISTGTTGPNPPALADPNSFKNAFVSKLREQPDAFKFGQQSFSSDTAKQAQGRIDSLVDYSPNFGNPNDQLIAKDWMSKYVQGWRERGLVEADRAVTPESLARFQTQHPGEGMGSKMGSMAQAPNYPGASGTKTS